MAASRHTSGVSRISARGGCLRSGPIRKVGRAVHFRSDIQKVGGGGGGTIRYRSDTKSGKGGGGASPLQVRYLCLAHRQYVIVNNKRLQF